MRDTQRKGDIAVTEAITTFTKMGYDVGLPLTESAAYDIFVDDGMGVKRVQVRYFSGLEVELRRIHSNSKGYVIKKTSRDAYDWLFVVNSKGEQFLIRECLHGRRSIRPKKEDKIILDT